MTETARKHHEELFPNHQSTLQTTDPELIEVFDNFAFDEVISYGNLDTRTAIFNFDFYNPTRIFFGKDRLEILDKPVFECFSRIYHCRVR